MNASRRARATKLLVVGVFAGLAALATACGSQAAASAPGSAGPGATAVAAEASQTREQRIVLAEEAVRNGRYELPGIGAFELKDGNFQEKYGEGATQVRKVGVVTFAFGDLDDDKVEDAAVVLWANTGGSGTFIYLTPVLNRGGKAEQAGSQMLGDRAQIKSLVVDSGKIKVEMLVQGPTDPMASPSVQSVQEYGLQSGTLARLTPAGPTPTLAPKPTQQPASQPVQGASSGLTGTIWIWDRYADNGEKGSYVVPYPAAYRLELLPDGKYSLQADCNRGSGTYTLEGSRLTLNPGPMTLAECRPGSRSKQFTEKLGQVATYVLKGDTLYLNLKTDSGDMVFSKLSSVTGRITGPAGATAPAGGTAEVMIVNSLGQQIGGSIVEARLPMEFEAPFKPANIDPSTAYTLEVTIKDAQKNVAFRSSRPYPVLTQGNPTYHLEVEVENVRLSAPAAGLGIDPRKVTLDTRGLPFPSYRVDRLAGSPYDFSTPPGPKGLPEHLAVGFGLIDQPGPRGYHPVMYIIPVEAYTQLWEQNGNGSVAKAVARIEGLAQQASAPGPIRGMPLLPYELTTGVNDLAVQVRRVTGGENSALGTGFRYVGRFAQDANPVTNNGRLRYIYQGFTKDGRYLVSFSCEVYTSVLPDHARVPQDVREKFASDPQGYMQETAAMLNALPSSAWELDLDRLDAFVSSLRFLEQ